MFGLEFDEFFVGFVVVYVDIVFFFFVDCGFLSDIVVVWFVVVIYVEMYVFWKG